MKASGAAVAGSVVSGFLASACCIGPVLLTLLGVSGGALAHRLEPLRPYLLAATYALLARAFYLAYRPEASACGPAETCTVPPARTAGRVILWIGTLLVVLFTTFPWYSQYLF